MSQTRLNQPKKPPKPANLWMVRWTWWTDNSYTADGGWWLTSALAYTTEDAAKSSANRLLADDFNYNVEIFTIDGD